MDTQIVNWNKDKQQKLLKYLENQKKLKLTAKLLWRGDKLVEFDVFEVPIKLLSHNFKNTRIRSELEGYLETKNQISNPDDLGQQEKVQDILLNSKWFGKIDTERLRDDLLKHGQLDPAVARPDGVLIDGNRRLAILCQLENDGKFSGLDYNRFSKMYVCFLPINSTHHDMKALEMRIQMVQPFQVKYGDINTALEFRHLYEDMGWKIGQIEDITKKRYKEKKIRTMIRIINIIDECLSLLPPKGKFEKQYTKLDKGWEGFANLDRILQWIEKTDPNNEEYHKRVKYLGFQIISSPCTTYHDIRKLYRILKLKQSSNEINITSHTLKGDNDLDPLAEDKIEKEIRYLENADHVWGNYHDSPQLKANAALKKLEMIKIRKQIEPDIELLAVINKIIKKAENIRSKFE